MRIARLFLLCVTAACSSNGTSAAPDTPASPSATVAQLGDSVRVTRGRPVALDGGRLTIAFTDLTDSRCPANAMCVWQGDAATTLRLDASGAVLTPTLHTALDPKRVAHAGYEVALLHVEPYPGTELPNVRVAPTAVLRVTRR